MIDNGRLRELVREIDTDIVRALPIDGANLRALSVSLRNWMGVLEGDGADADWVDELRFYRNNLEYVNAFFIESGRQELDAEEVLQAEETISELRAALTPYKQ